MALGQLAALAQLASHPHYIQPYLNIMGQLKSIAACGQPLSESPQLLAVAEHHIAMLEVSGRCRWAAAIPGGKGRCWQHGGCEVGDVCQPTQLTPVRGCWC